MLFPPVRQAVIRVGWRGLDALGAQAHGGDGDKKESDAYDNYIIHYIPISHTK